MKVETGGRKRQKNVVEGWREGRKERLEVEGRDKGKEGSVRGENLPRDSGTPRRIVSPTTGTEIEEVIGRGKK